MTERDFERLSAYFDGELLPEEMAEIETALETNPELQAAFDAMSRTHASLSPAFSRAMHEAPPERLTEILVYPAEKRRNDRTGGWLKSLLNPAALAGATAALAIGLVAGSMLTPQTKDSNNFVLASGDRIVAGTELARLLETSSSGEITPTNIGNGVITLSLALEDNRHCRQFHLGSSAGVACTNESDGWSVETLVSSPPINSSSHLQLASRDVPDAIRITLESFGTVEPLDAEAESKQIERNWR